MANTSGILALRASTAFRCLMGQCPLSCCAGWQVEIDSSAASRLHTIRLPRARSSQPMLPAIAGNAADESGALAANRLTASTPSDLALALSRYALVEPDRNCDFWGNDGLCDLQRQGLSPALPASCLTYPRMVQRGPQGLEFSLEPTCPEHTRLLLETPDGDHPLYLTPDRALERAKVVADTPALQRPWGRGLEVVRSTLTALLADEGADVRLRLLAAASFARESGDFFRPSSGPRSRRDLEECARRHLGEAHRQGLARTLARTTSNGHAVLRVLAELTAPMLSRLIADANALSPTRLDPGRALLHTTLRGLGHPLVPVNGAAVAWDSALQTRERARHHVLDRYGSSLDRMMVPLARDYVFSRRYFEDADLHDYFQRLLTELALVRWFVPAYLTQCPAQPPLAPPLAPVVAQFVALLHRLLITEPHYPTRLASLLERADLRSLSGSLQLILF